MTSERRRVSTLIVFATLGLIVLLGVHPVSADRIVAGYVLALAAIALASLTRILSDAVDTRASTFEHALSRRRAEPPRPSDLIRVEREITLALSSAGHVHNRLLPLLREIAAARLGFELDLRPAAARARVGEDCWELLRPDRPAPENKNAPGLRQRDVRALVEALERL
jgi:hypothetical protein